ncbi:hypothetical protein PInf_024947 [Phytophthora infestans]|nr:hypothetical protein PInf_024947 [Phytophthora infestans]
MLKRRTLGHVMYSAAKVQADTVVARVFPCPGLKSVLDGSVDTATSRMLSWVAVSRKRDLPGRWKAVRLQRVGLEKLLVCLTSRHRAMLAAK